MNSIGILYTLRNSSEPSKINVSAELHVNYWKVPVRNGAYKRFLDFGIFINDVAREVSSVSFYFPFKVEAQSLKDLGESLSKSELLCTLFNNDYVVRNINGSPSYFCISPSSNSEKAHPFWLYVLGENNFKVSDIKPNGSVVNVKILSTPKKNGGIQPASNEKKPKRNLYFRFRVEDIPENSIFYEENISNDFLQSAFSKTEMIDFRINEVREMNPKAYEEITKDKTFLPFSKIHFFFVGSSEDEQIAGNTDYKDCRLLNYDRWQAYIGDNYDSTRKLIAYHWCWKGDTNAQTRDRYSIFIKTVYKSIIWKTVLKYCSVVFGLSLVSTIVWDAIKAFPCFINWIVELCK